MTKDGVESPSDVVSELLTYILDVCRAPYSEPPPPPDCYLPPCSIESELSFSHSFIFELGRETMLLTTCWKTNTLIYAENCPMAILHFPHGGIFTSFCCPHGICSCLKWMQSCESPIGIHSTILNREPNFFANTLFVVDRFNWWGHVGCSSGYCLDTYKYMSLKYINSQWMSKCWTSKN